MIAATRDFAHDLGTRHLPTQRKDEIGQLARSIQGMQAQIRQQVQTLRDSQEQLQFLADHDMLTGLPNRRLFQDRLTSALTRAKRDRFPVALLFVDLDRFKQINDEHGHDCGDAVLVETGKRLRGALRESDTVARLGGDEFVVLLEKPGTRDDIDRIVGKIRSALRADFVWEASTLRIGASVGVSLYPQQGMSAEELVASADRAMYHAKARRDLPAEDSPVT